MKKKLIALVSVAVLAVSFSTVAFATGTPNKPANFAGCATGVRGSDLMMDQDGKIVDADTFKANVEKAIKDGQIKSEDKDAYLQMYEFCKSNGGVRGGCGRRGNCGGFANRS